MLLSGIPEGRSIRGLRPCPAQSSCQEIATRSVLGLPQRCSAHKAMLTCWQMRNAASFSTICSRLRQGGADPTRAVLWPGLIGA